MDGRLKLKGIFSNIGLFYSAAIWGSTFFIVKRSLDGVDPVILVGYRFVIAALGLMIPLLILRRKLWSNIREGIILGLLIWILYISQTIGLKYTTAANSGLITGLFVAFVPLFSITLMRKVPSMAAILATLISIAGLWVLTGGLQRINIGDLITLISAIAYAIHILYADNYVKAGFDPYILSFQQFAFVGIASLVTGLIFRFDFSVATTEIFGMIIFLAIFPSLSAFAIQLVAQKYVTPVRVSLILAFEPVFAVIFAWTLGNEAYSFNKALGGILIFLALVISSLPSRPVVAKTKKAPVD